MRKHLGAVALVSMLVFAGMIATASSAFAQRSSVVQFKPGNYGTHVSGTITGREYIDYKITARRGQKLFVELAVGGTNGTGSVFFNILPPRSQGQAIYNSSTSENTTTVTLPRNGQYTIRVYLMGEDRSANKTVGFELDLSIQ